MINRKIKNALSNAVNSAPTLPFEELAAMPYIKMTEHDYITRQENKRNTSHIRQFVLAAAMCLLILLPASNWYYQNKVRDSVITLDVNPSIEIITNHKDRVLLVEALNEDAKAIIGESDYKNSSLEDTVSALLNSLIEHNYIDAEKNTIMLTVTNKDNQKADRILLTMGAAIKETLKVNNISPNIMGQILAKEAKRSELADEYNISEGKMRLIQDIISVNDALTAEKLAGMSMEQLAELAEENKVDMNNYQRFDDDKDSESGESQEDMSEEASEYSNQEDSEENEDGEDAYEKEDSASEDKRDSAEEDSEEYNGFEDEDKEDEDSDYEKEDSGIRDSEEHKESTYGEDRDARGDSQEAYKDEENTKGNAGEDEEYSSGEGDEGSIEDGEDDAEEDNNTVEQDSITQDERISEDAQRDASRNTDELTEGEQEDLESDTHEEGISDNESDNSTEDNFQATENDTSEYEESDSESGYED